MALADGHFCSGEVLGEALEISRSAVSKHIKYLSELGLEIYSVQGKGYRLAKSLSLLNKNTILSLLDSHDASQLIVLNVIDSTNQYIKNHQSKLKSGFVCLAEAQTAGRGRHGKTWVSPYGASLYMSMHWEFSAGYQGLGGLSLAVGVAVVRALAKFGISGVQLKWPNDIYLEGKKLAGVLIEVDGHFGGACQCIIGIGLNVDLPENITNIDQSYIDISSVLSSRVDRNTLAALLINELTASIIKFELLGFSSFVDAWRAVDVYANMPIKLIMGQNIIEGVGRGIDDTGALLIETEEGVKTFQGGEISVRPA